PDKAIDLIDEAAARIRVQRSMAPEAVHKLREEMVMVQRAKEYAIMHHDFPAASKERSREMHLHQQLGEAEQQWANSHEQQRPVVGEQEIAQVIAMWTGIPVMQIAAV